MPLEDIHQGQENGLILDMILKQTHSITVSAIGQDWAEQGQKF